MPDLVAGDGDVKYHLGYDSEFNTGSRAQVSLHLADHRIVTRARITGTVVDALGKPKLPEVFKQLRNSTLLSETP